MSGKSDFKNLFLLKEFEDLAGKSKRSIWALSLILALTLCALGYSVGGTKYLKAKMDDPFTNWVNMTVRNSYKDKIPNLLHHFENEANKDSFHLDNISKYVIEHYLFQNPTTNGLFNKKIRTIDTDGDLLKEILHVKNTNVVAGYEYREGKDLDFPNCAMIFKESALKDALGIQDINSLKRIPFILGDFLIYCDVFAVVKELPNRADVLISNHLYNLLQKEFGKTGFMSVNSTNKFIVHGKLSAGYEGNLEDDIRKELKNRNILSVDVGEFEINNDIKLSELTIYSSDYFELDTLKHIINELIGKQYYEFANLYVESNCSTKQIFSEIMNPYYLAFNFAKLDKVREFNNYLKSDNRYLMEITMDQVESKENFALVSRLTSFLAIILLIFSFLSIVFYINSLLSKHLEKIKQNLGTLKAFGLKNSFLVTTYVGIIMLFMVISMVAAFIICLILAYIETLIFTIPIIDLYDYRIYLAILVILLIAMLTSYFSIKRILLKTPGDLIYNR